MNKFIFASYVLTLFLFLIFSYAFVDPNLSYLKVLYSGFAFDHRTVATIIYGFLMSFLFAFYLYVLRISKNKLKFKEIKALIVLAIAILLFSYPAMLSYDIFNYITTAKVTFFYRENPYIVMPIEFPRDPYLPFTRAANKLALYGPSWILASAVPYFLGFGNFILTLLNFKIFIAAFYLGTVFLIWKISKSIFSVAFFSLNPLVLIETLASSHNDIFMMFFALLSFYFIKENKTALSSVSLAVSALVKYSTFFVVPVFGYIFLKKIIKSKVSWDNVFYATSIVMFFAFFLSPIREEMYPWYAIWPLAFVSLVSDRKWLVRLSLLISFGLMLRYIPYMLSGTYFGTTPIFREVLTIIPFVVGVFYLLLKKIWVKVQV